MAPGFSRVLIRPHLGKLNRVSGAIPHPQGEIAVKLTRNGDGLDVEIGLPKTVVGEFEWRGQRRSLTGGTNRFRL
jgi:hypothetical protein